MPQSGYTPIQLYSSSTPTSQPAAGNLTNDTKGSELAINITDGKLFYKDNANAVQVIGWKVAPATAGGTGQTSYAVGDLLYADTTTTLAKLPDVATGNALISGGVNTAPLWGKVGLTTHVSGVLPVANGGTNLASGTSGGILGYTATGTLASSAVLAANALMVGGGAGATPTTITTGTGVNTALGVNTGAAGAFVVNGGVLGTPSSGTVTNLTGTASININGTVGATTANTGAFTTVTASSTITPSQTAGIVGTTTNNDANAGSVGEFISSTILQANRVGLTSGTPVNVTSISLTAGDWDVTALLGLSENSSTAWTYYAGSISTVSATLSTLQTNNILGSINSSTLAVVNAFIQAPVVRVSLASTTTYYLVAQGGFTGGSGQAAFGTIRARRVR
jgi:hypothetical protein